MNNWGQLFRKLRKERHLTLQQVADDVNSVSFISKFEKGDSQITFNRLMHLLGKINFSVEEFLYANGRHANKAIDSTFMSYRPIYLTADFMTPIVTFMHNLNISDDDYRADKARIQKDFDVKVNALEKNGPSDWHHYIAILYEIQEVIFEADIRPDAARQSAQLFERIRLMARPIVTYLYNIENWSAFEILLFSISHIAMPVETVHRLEKIAIKRTSEDQTFPMMPQIRFSLLFSLFSTYINFRQLPWAKETLDQIEALLKHAEDAGVAIMLRFYRGWYDYINSNGQTGDDKMQDALSIANILKLSETASEIAKIIPIIKENQKDPSKSMIFIL
ncbi:helix-turn-helix domain-containing protein [Lentilactobacillus sunkii]|uniref:Rgg GadR MutR family transcriptional activator n=1 Tax=Lentilactobacillus sunkii DSM 19904 TaxID=1423808 RepID=A0A0R1KU96_9LACO|nr:Rgg/GadR/MutR family transcriptional regulator [Lentilactobacillus sunkii]KRK87067.1 Rgg GadR MutR family transcriptional activator [Lentilactobacillus sunkii DSM 19904]